MNITRIEASTAFVGLLALQACGGGTDVMAPVALTQSTEPILSTSSTSLGPAMTIGAPVWADGSSAEGPAMAAAAGVACLVNEDYHIHTHLSILVDGVAQAVPPHIGLGACAYEVHTHDSSGVIHIETAVEKSFTLGQFFAVWGHQLSRADVAGINQPVTVYTVDGSAKPVRYDGAPGLLPLRSHQSVYLVLGRMPRELPAFFGAPACSGASQAKRNRHRRRGARSKRRIQNRSPE